MAEATNGIVLIMGVTGAGKSYFVNKLKPGSVEEGHELESKTTAPQAVQVFLDEDEKTSVTVVDTPGFDDTYRKDGEVLADITSFLATQYQAQIPLYGIIYLHRIGDNRMRGTSRRYLDIFRDLCGDTALKHVILVTTGWDSVSEDDRRKALNREQELVDKYWARMIERGSYYTQFDGTKDSAETLVLELIHGRANVVLDIQREMVDHDKPVCESTAGRKLGAQVQDDLRFYHESKTRTERKLKEAVEDKDKEEIDSLRKDLEEVSGIIKQLEKSDKRLKAKIAREAKGKLEKARVDDEEQRKRKRDHVTVTAAISVFTAAVGIALTVVKFVAFGGV